MSREFFLDLAARGLRLPIATHMVLHEHADHEQIVLDGARLGKVIIEAARRYKSPLAVPLMNLALEKEALLAVLGVPPDERERFYFHSVPDSCPIEQIKTEEFITPHMAAVCDAIRYTAQREEEEGVVSLGMGIGPFSLMTKLISDPITPVFMAGTGIGPEEDDDVALLEFVLEISTQIIIRYLTAQAEAGARAVIVCEPAANRVYFSPNQLAGGANVFERFVMTPNLEIKAALDKAGADLIFHDCGELTDGMVRSFNRLRPVMLSLGCSRRLWEDAALLEKDIVLYGNLPSKNFYSDEAVRVEDVERMTRELIINMERAEHPFIMGTECDVLSVPGRDKTIRSKIDAMMSCAV